MKVNSKFLAVAVVAMFCTAGFIAVASSDSDADKVTYHFYLQLNDDTLNTKPIEKWLSPIEMDSESEDSCLAGLAQALKDAGLSYEMDPDGWLHAIGDFREHGDVHTTSYYSFAVYNTDWKDWKRTFEYDKGTTFAVVFDKYLWEDEYNKLSDDEKADYYYENSYATLLPKVSTTSYESDDTFFLIVGVIAVVAVIALICVAIAFTLKNRKTE